MGGDIFRFCGSIGERTEGTTRKITVLTRRINLRYFVNCLGRLNEVRG